MYFEREIILKERKNGMSMRVQASQDLDIVDDRIIKKERRNNFD
jgi:hypothetical protein